MIKNNACKKNDYYNCINLFFKNRWLSSKEKELRELINFCDKKESKDLLFSLLGRFYYLDYENYNTILNGIADYIVNDSGFCEVNTQLLSLTWDEEADSSQRVLDSIKHPVYKRGWHSIKTVNVFGKAINAYSTGKTQILMIDEFIGSGKTLKNRLNYLRKNIQGKFEVKCCFVAGIKPVISELTEEGVDIFCPLQFDKGISDYFKGTELSTVEDLMLDLELKLAQKINEKELYNYSFGYGSAEALYTMEGCNGNTPNSTFPIFWWLQDKNGNLRNTLLTRFEIGF